MCLTSVLHVNESAAGVTYNRRRIWRHEADMSLCLKPHKFCCSQSIREDRGNQVKSASSCVSGSDRHAEHQLFQSTNLPTSGIAGRFANVAETPEATIKHIHAACRRGQHLLAVEPRHFHAAAVWQRKQTQVGSQKFQVSSSFK